jgi:hypothetical protein
MRNLFGRLVFLARVAAVVAFVLAAATPASAQFGGLKKKLKAEAAPETAEPAGGDAGGGTGTVVLTPDVVERLVAGLKAGEVERQAAAKANTPYGTYQRDLAAYEAAQLKCQAGQQSFANRMAADEKLMDRYNTLVNKMVEAQGRGDSKGTMAYNDSAMAMQDPHCVVKEPQQPENYYQVQREVESRAEQQAMKTSGFSRSEYAQVRERAEAVLRGGTPPGDLSDSERSAVSSRAAELKPLLGIRDPEREVKTAAAPAPPPAPAQPTPAVPAGSSELSACVTRNAQKHEKELRALGERAQVAQEAGDTERLMAMADTIQQLQMAGCTGPR